MEQKKNLEYLRKILQKQRVIQKIIKEQKIAKDDRIKNTEIKKKLRKKFSLSLIQLSTNIMIRLGCMSINGKLSFDTITALSDKDLL